MTASSARITAITATGTRHQCGRILITGESMRESDVERGASRG